MNIFLTINGGGVVYRLEDRQPENFSLLNCGDVL